MKLTSLLVLAALAISNVVFAQGKCNNAQYTSAQGTWSELVARALAKNGPVEVWGMDEAETRHSFLVTTSDQEKGKIYLIHDENRERDFTHTILVTDLKGERLYFGKSVYTSYGSPSVSSDVSKDVKGFLAHKALLLKLAGN